MGLCKSSMFFAGDPYHILEDRVVIFNYNSLGATKRGCGGWCGEEYTRAPTPVCVSFLLGKPNPFQGFKSGFEITSILQGGTDCVALGRGNFFSI